MHARRPIAGPPALDTPTQALSPPSPPRLLAQVRACLRYKHYSYRTEQAYVAWIRQFIHFHELRHPRDMGAQEVERFLNHLANVRNVASSTHNQALSALLFLYGQVLGIELPWLHEIARPKRLRRLPVVLTRIKDVDMARHEIVVRQGKGGKDRVTMLPATLVPDLRQQVARAKSIWQFDRSRNAPGVELPHALARKYADAATAWAWFWVFPAPSLSRDPRSDIVRRHHLHEELLQRAIRKAVRVSGIDKPATAHTLGMHSPRTYWNRERTSVPCRSCSVTATSARR